MDCPRDRLCDLARVFGRAAPVQRRNRLRDGRCPARDGRRLARARLSRSGSARTRYRPDAAPGGGARPRQPEGSRGRCGRGRCTLPAGGLAAGRLPLLSRSLAQEAPPQAPAGQPCVREAGREPPRARRAIFFLRPTGFPMRSTCWECWKATPGFETSRGPGASRRAHRSGRLPDSSGGQRASVTPCGTSPSSGSIPARDSRDAGPRRDADRSRDWRGTLPSLGTKPRDDWFEGVAGAGVRVRDRSARPLDGRGKQWEKRVRASTTTR